MNNNTTEEYIPEGMVLPKGDPDVDADTTNRMRLPDIAVKKEDADIGLTRGGFEQYLKEREADPSTSSGSVEASGSEGAVAEPVDPEGAVAEPVEAPAGEETPVDPSTSSGSDTAKPARRTVYPDTFDIPFTEGDDFDIRLEKNR